MTGLGADLRTRIVRDGPLTVAAYMAEALGHPEFGYYTRRDPLGAAGDFVTAPEISQMFGEIIGLWCLSLWEALGRPDPFRLIELGPGRGTLMADLWRAAALRPAFHAAARLHLIETSPALTKIQRAVLPRCKATWHASFAEAAAREPETPLIVIANEFFDALPVHQIERTQAGWRERLIGIDPDNARFRFETATRETPAVALVPAAFNDAPQGSVFEVCPEGQRLTHALATEIAVCRGAALIVDYGPGRSGLGATFQAVRRHRFHDPLCDPGEVDLTAHVDFESLAAAAAQTGARVWGPISQGLFLRRLGIEARAAALLRAATPAQARDIPAALKRLIDPDQMGNLFKALVIADPGLPAPPGSQDMA